MRNIKSIGRKLIAWPSLFMKRIMDAMQRIVHGLGTLTQKRADARKLDFEYIDFLKRTIVQLEKERDLYRDLCLKLENPESDLANFSSLELRKPFEPWSVKRRKIEALKRKKKEEASA
jgi:hypothetical protein